jgi:hypothetical protein
MTRYLVKHRDNFTLYLPYHVIFFNLLQDVEQGLIDTSVEAWMSVSRTHFEAALPDPLAVFIMVRW